MLFLLMLPWMLVQQPRSHVLPQGQTCAPHTGKHQRLQPSALQTFPSGCVTALLYTQLIKGWLHTPALSGLSRGDVIRSCNWNANIPGGTRRRSGGLMVQRPPVVRPAVRWSVVYCARRVVKRRLVCWAAKCLSWVDCLYCSHVITAV